MLRFLTFGFALLLASGAWAQAPLDTVSVVSTTDVEVCGQACVDDLQAQITANAGAVAALDTRVAALEATAADHETRITALEDAGGGAHTHLQAEVDGLETRLSALDDATTGRVTVNEQDIDSLNTVVAGKADQSDLDVLTDRVTAAEGNIANNDTDIAALQQADVDFAARVALLDDPTTGRVTVAEGRIDVLELDRDGILSRLDDAEEAILNRVEIASDSPVQSPVYWYGTQTQCDAVAAKDASTTYVCQ